ncbi:hypothetical protein D3C72_275540 [compost metagenome]
MKGTAQIAREVIAEAVAATASARTETSSTLREVEAGIAVLEYGFQKIEPSIVLDILMDARPTSIHTNGLILANDRASAFVPVENVGRAWRIDRSGLGKVEIVIPTKTADAVQRLVAALGSVVEDFDVWSHGVARSNGRLRA